MTHSNKWQAIDTAPKDGSTVLISDATHVNEAHYESDVGERLVSEYPTPYWEPYDHSYWDIHAHNYDWFDPTHWMPLPAPPSVSSEPPPKTA